MLQRKGKASKKLPDVKNKSSAGSKQHIL